MNGFLIFWREKMGLQYFKVQFRGRIIEYKDI